MIFSLSMLPPIIVSYIFHEGAWQPFLSSFLFTLVAGFFCWIPFRFAKEELKTGDGFIIVVLMWSVACLFGALPFLLSPNPAIGFTDALFESTSGITTTGASILSGLEHLPNAIRYYRQQLHVLGGMGIIVLAVAILPMLGVGGMQLFKAEMPSPLKETKITPRIKETAKALWYIYATFVVLCILSYWAAGMSVFDAIGEGFSTVATGGFSMHDSSFAYYNNSTIEIIGIIFMLLSGTNFALHFFAIQNRNFREYLHNLEFKAFITIILSVIAVVSIVLWTNNVYGDKLHTLMKTAFNVVSLATTSGLTSAPYSTWPSFVPILITIIAVIGGCAGSTSGGIKVLRFLLLQKQGAREVKRLVHPEAVLTIKFGKLTLPENVIEAMWGFIATFAVISIFIILALMATGLDLTTSYGALVATLANAGASIGDVAGGFQDVTPVAKWILIFAMLAGRLEIFTLLVLFTPEFWRR